MIECKRKEKIEKLYNNKKTSIVIKMKKRKQKEKLDVLMKCNLFLNEAMKI